MMKGSSGGFTALRRQLEQIAWVNKWPRIIQDWLYPPTCLLCGDPGDRGRDLCKPCADSLPRIMTACPRCAVPLASIESQLCGPCQTRPPVFDAAHAPLHYEEPVRHLVVSLKFGARYPSARLLGALLADSLASRANLPEVIIPVPLHPSRYRKRGFNQSTEIARVVSRRLAIPLDLHACRRVRATTAQSRLTARERRRNVRRAFACPSALPYRHVAIIDDVLTTGMTANEVARTLRRAGVEKIEVWACARTGH
ncbi:ComF family protein [Methylomagnum sp.]